MFMVQNWPNMPTDMKLVRQGPTAQLKGGTHSMQREIKTGSPRSKYLLITLDAQPEISHTDHIAATSGTASEHPDSLVFYT